MGFVEKRMTSCGGNCRRCCSGVAGHGVFLFAISGSRSGGKDTRKAALITSKEGGGRLDVRPAADPPGEDGRRKIVRAVSGGRKPLPNTFRDALIAAFVEAEIAERGESGTDADENTMRYMAGTAGERALDEARREVRASGVRDVDSLHVEIRERIVAVAVGRYLEERRAVARLISRSEDQYASNLMILEAAGADHLPDEILSLKAALKKLQRSEKRELDEAVESDPGADVAALKASLKERNESARTEIAEGIKSLQQKIAGVLERAVSSLARAA